MRAMLVLFVVCLVAGCEGKPAGKGGGSTTPPKKDEPKKAPGGPSFKNASELGAYLNDRGVKLTVNPAAALDRPERPCSSFWGEGDKGSVLVYLCRTEDEAETLAGTSGDKGFRYGRFVFVNQFDYKPESGVLFRAIKDALR